MIVSDSDQWLSNGDCTKCRRRKYCSETCKPQKIEAKNMTDAMVREAVLRHALKSSQGERDL